MPLKVAAGGTLLTFIDFEDYHCIHLQNLSATRRLQSVQSQSMLIEHLLSGRQFVRPA